MAEKNQQGWNKEGLNPGDDYARDTFNPQRRAAENLQGQENDATPNDTNGDVANQEANGGIKAPGRIGRASNAIGGALGSAGAVGATTALYNFILGHKTSSSTVAALIIGIVFMVTSIVTPLGILGFVKETLSKWAHHFPELGTNRRIIKIGQARYFDYPECTGSRFKCRHHKGISKSEAKRFEKAGIELKGEYKKGSKTFYREMVFADADGTKHTVTGATFEEFMRKNPVFRARMNKIITGRSILTRSAAVLKNVFKRLLINRKNPAGEDKDTKEGRLSKLRNYFYGQIDRLKAYLRSTEVPEKDANGNPVQNAKEANSAFDATQSDISEQNNRALAGKLLPGDIPSARGLFKSSGTALKNLAEKAKGISKSALGGLFKGIFKSISAYCTAYQLVRVVAFTSKVLMAAQLIRFVMVYLTEYDRDKEGDGKSGNIASFLADTLLQPSREEGSVGKTFADSAGWVAITQGGIIDREAMIRFATGGAIMLLFGRIKKLMELGGAVSPAFCKHLNAWYGQAGVIIGGVISSLLTGFGGAVVGVLTGVASYLLTATIMKYALPALLAMASGAVIPDMTNDPGGGYDKGNAMASGVAALGDWTAKADAQAPATEKQLLQVQKDNFVDMQTELAAEDIDNREMGIFSPDNPMSFQNQMAGALLPYASGIVGMKNAASAILSGGSLIQNALATIPNMFTRSASAINGADPESINFYRGDACPDEALQSLGYARTFSCSTIRVDSGPYRNFEDIKADLEKQGFIDHDEPNDEMQHYYDVCHASSDYPVDPSGLNIDGTNSDGKMCFSKDEKYHLFREYYQSAIVDDSLDQAGEGTLGLENPGAQL